MTCGMLTPALTCTLIGSILAGCAGDYRTAQDVTQVDQQSRMDSVLREARLEATALRGELAAARILLAKKEAELLELRRQIIEARKSEGESRQAIQIKQDEIETLRNEINQVARSGDTTKTSVSEFGVPTKPLESSANGTNVSDQLNDLKSLVGRLSEEIDQMKHTAARAGTTFTGKQATSAKPVSTQSDSLPNERQPAQSSIRLIDHALIEPSSDHRQQDQSIEGRPAWIIVEAGDSLWSLAKRYGITVDQLKASNNLISDRLTVGQRLQLIRSHSGGHIGQ